MKKKLVLLMITLAVTSFAADKVEAKNEDQDDRRTVKDCIARWGKTPFDADTSDFRIVKAGVKVVGIGRDVVDVEKTAKPQLLLVKPSVNVLAKTSFRLENPNGWYCFKANVNVLGKSEIEAHCDAQLMASNKDVTVLGQGGGEGVTVLGKSVIRRFDCPEKKSDE